MFVYGKCSDLGNITVEDDEGNIIIDHEGYTPDDIGIGGGDDIEFEVDIATGRILNWDAAAVIKGLQAIEQDDEDDEDEEDDDSYFGLNDD